MADFGLAAQIGRGGGMVGPAPVDPSNRMMQLLQMQQLQQNMLLAREQNAREAALAPLRMRNIEADIAATGARTALTTTQGASAQLELEDKKRLQRVNRGMIEVMGLHDEGKIDLSKPESIRAISDPEIRMAVRDRLAQSREIMARAQRAGLELEGVQNAVSLDFLDRALDGIDNPRSFNAAYNKALKIFPDLPDFVSNEFNKTNIDRFADLVRSRSATIQDVNGVPFLRRPGSAVLRETTIAPASLPTGNLAAVSPGAVADSDVATRIAAGTPIDVGAMPSGIPGQRLPAAGEPGFVSFVPAGSAAAAPPPAAAPAAAPAAQPRGPQSATEFLSERETAKRKAELEAARPKVDTSLIAAVDSIDKQLRSIRELKERPFGRTAATGPLLGTAANPLRYAIFDPFGVQGAQARIDNLLSQGTLNALTELRRAAPTGAALGNTSDKDIELLKFSQGALSQRQSTTDFDKALANLERDLVLARRRLQDAYTRDYGAPPPKNEGGPLSNTAVRTSDTSVLLPDGRTVNLPSKAAADKFMERVGQ